MAANSQLAMFTGKSGVVLYGSGMHDFIIRDLELGERVAMWQDDEDCGFGALFDRSFEEYVKAHPPSTVSGTEVF